MQVRQVELLAVVVGARRGTVNVCACHGKVISLRVFAAYPYLTFNRLFGLVIAAVTRVYHTSFHWVFLLSEFNFLSFDGDKRKRKRDVIDPYISLNYRPSGVAARQCTSPLTGSAVPFKLLHEKDKDLICPRHLLYHLGTDFPYDFAILYTGEIACKYVLKTLLLVAHGAEYILVQNVGDKVGLHTTRIDYLFIVLAYVLEHIFDAVADFIDIVDGRKIASPEPLVEKAVLYALFPPAPLGAVIFVFLQFARHLSFRYVGEGVEV